MEQVADLTERPRLDRIDQHPHSLVQRLRAVDRLGRTLAALGAVFGGAPFGRIGTAPRKESLAPSRELLRRGAIRQARDRPRARTCLDEIYTAHGDRAPPHLPRRI